LTLASGIFHIISFDCVPLGSAVVSAFLDDNGNAAETDVSSSDPLDACSAVPAVTVPVRDGTTTAVAYRLAVPCE
jgi:hypothetical protein